MTLGGVGRNLAAGLELLGHEPIFITSLAGDNLAEFALNEMGKLGFGLGSRLKVLNWCPGPGGGDTQQVSSCFALVLIDSLTGQCEYVIANLDASKAISSQALDELRLVGACGDEEIPVPLSAQLATAPLVVLDSNLPGNTLEHLVKLCHNWQVPIFLEPTDVVCLPSVVDSLDNISKQNPQLLDSLCYLSPNSVELDKLLELFSEKLDGRKKEQTIGDEHDLDRIEAMARQLMQIHLPLLKCLLVTMDKQGVLVGTRLSSSTTGSGSGNASAPVGLLEFKHYRPARVIERPVSASGAGDCFAAGFIGGLIDQLPTDECVERGFRAAACALNDKSTVPLSLRTLVET